MSDLAGTKEARDLDIEYRILTPEGSVVEVRTIARCEAPVGGVPSAIRGVTLDVTKQKKLELDLNQAQKLESVGRLASGVAHEINTPVQFVSDSVHFLRQAMGDLTNILEKYRGAMKAALSRCLAG